MLTQTRLQHVLRYDPITGLFYWRLRRGRQCTGSIAGSLNETGYVQIRIDGVIYLAHRLAWLWVHGVWPSDELDHEDLVKHHNWLGNLREATPVQNAGNVSISSKNVSGYKGVSLHKPTGLWRARIKINYKGTTIGYFKTPQDAHAVYVVAAQKHFGNFARAA